jgi:hypothetical protein
LGFVGRADRLEQTQRPAAVARVLAHEHGMAVFDAIVRSAKTGKIETVM